MKNFLKKYLIIWIILLSLSLRLYGLNWDQNQHLNPDERFITMVVGSMELPSNLTQYFDPKISKLNPFNIGYPFYVYGNLPLVITKLLGNLTNRSDYHQIALVGRLLSGIFDTASIIFIFLIAKLLEKKYRFDQSIKYYSSFIYGIAVSPIQHSHFFIVDTFLTFFAVGTVYFALRFNLKKTRINLILAAFCLSLAIASKINAILFIPLIGLMLIDFNNKDNKDLIKFISKNLINLAIFLPIFYLGLRIVSPFYFSSGNWFNFNLSMLNQQFIASISSLNNFANPDAWYPPGIQWINQPPALFVLKNMILFHFGIMAFILLITGCYYQIKKRKLLVLIIFLWLISFFIYQSVQYAKSPRYIYPLYPYIAIFAGSGMYYLISRFKKRDRKIVNLLIAILLLIWPLAFMAIYSRPHSRVMASDWIYQNVPAGRVLTSELWDDALPLRINNRNPEEYKIIVTKPFDIDTPIKWQEFNQQLAQADYIVLSSNRGYGSIAGPGRKKYPLMSKFYDDLFAGRTQFQKIKEITSYPGLCLPKMFNVPCFMINDDMAEETFTVYDHPKVIIFKKI